MAHSPKSDTDWRTQDIKIDRSVYDLAAGVLLVIVATVIGLALFPNDRGFQGNLYTTILGVLITIFVLDRRAERREALRAENELKARLIREMGSSVNEVAIRAVEELRAKGWLTDGTAAGTRLQSANLEHANLQDARLQAADLLMANLQSVDLSGAYLREATLVMANLQGAEAGGKEQVPDSILNLSGARLQQARMQSISFIYANLENTDLSFAHLNDAVFGQVNLEGASLKEANMLNVMLATAQFNTATVLPDGTNWTPDTDMSRFTNANHPQFWRSNNPNSPAFSHR